MRKNLKKLALTLTAFTLCLAPALNSYAATKVRLQAPSEAYWTDKTGEEDEGSYAHWSAVEHAKEYEVYLYYLNDNDSYTKLSEHKTKNLSVNLRGKMTKDAEYAFRVRAVGKGMYQTSNWSDYSDTVYYDKVGSGAASTNNSGTSSENKGPGSQKEATYIGASSGWQKNDIGWWFATNPVGTTWYESCWQWIDGNKDGIAECYYFDANGYAMLNTTTPDGYQVNGDGAWIVNGVVQTKAA